MKQIKFPNKVMFEATNYCNNRCFFCGGTVCERKKGYMDSNLMYRLIDEAYVNGARTISFHGMGEPFLCEDLAEYVSRAKKVGYEYIYLDSNGVLATPERVNKVIEAGLDSLKFSIHTINRETYKKITDNDACDTIIDNLIKLNSYIKTNNLHCKLIAYMAVSTLNENEVKDFKSFMEQYADEVWIRPIHNGCGVMKSNSDYAVTEKIAAYDKRPCQDLYDYMFVNWQGKAAACCTDWTESLIYGDVQSTSLEELWNNKEITKIREIHCGEGPLIDICEKCMSD